MNRRGGPYSSRLEKGDLTSLVNTPYAITQGLKVIVRARSKDEALAIKRVMELRGEINLEVYPLKQGLIAFEGEGD